MAGTTSKWLPVTLLWVAGFAGISLAILDQTEQKQPVLDWMGSPGTLGFVNLDDVKDAFNQSKSLEAFEGRINEISEGDGLILLKPSGNLRPRGRHPHLRLIACEDLNFNRKACDKQDDPLFTLEVKNGKATLKGMPKGPNEYYSAHWNYPTSESERVEEDGSRPGHLYSSYTYINYSTYDNETPRQRGKRLAMDRRRYRSTQAFQKQVIRNADFEGRMAQRYTSNFARSVNKVSNRRVSYLSRRLSSKSFSQSVDSSRRQSAWGMRKAMAKGTTGSRTAFSSRGSQAGAAAFTTSRFARSGGVARMSSSYSRGGFRSSSGFSV